MTHRPPRRRFGLFALTAALCLAAGATARAPDPAPAPKPATADPLLNAARKAYNDKQYPDSANRFREFLAKSGGHPERMSAHLGLGLSLLEGATKDYAKAAEALGPPANDRNFADHALAQYYLGYSHRGLAVAELDKGRANPKELPQRRDAARGRFAEAARNFAESAKSYSAKLPAALKPADPVPAELDWAARARCDWSEMELRQSKTKEAREAAAPFLKDALLARSRYLGQGAYLHGYSSLLLDELPAAARSLSQKAALADPVVGPHAHFLLGRVYQQTNELPEAAARFDAALAGYEQGKKDASEALKSPDQFRDRPDEKARLEALVRDPAPDHVGQAAFFSGALLYQSGRFGEAAGRFSDFLKQYPKHPRAAEAQFHLGCCQFQLKQYDEAAKTLTPLPDAEPRLADQALLWLAKAKAIGGDQSNPQVRAAALNSAIDLAARAAERSAQLATTANDAEAPARRAEALLERADLLQAAGKHREAAQAYEQLIGEKRLPARQEELYQRIIDALGLAGDTPKADAWAERFAAEFPRSPLTPAVLFRRGEVAYFAALAAEKQAGRSKDDVAKLYADAAKRYAEVAEKFPEFERASAARYGAALAALKRSDYAAAERVLRDIPPPDRVGELTPTPYLLAECLLRQAPAQADDALAAGKLQEALVECVALLDSFVSAAPKSAEAPDALFKLAHCHHRLARLLAKKEDKALALQNARTAYEKLAQQYGSSPLLGRAVLERAKVLGDQGDKGSAVNELRRFTAEPLLNDYAAALGVVQLAAMLREQNRAEDAAQIIAGARQKLESSLSRDPRRASWVAMLRYHQGVALMEAKRVPEARKLLLEAAEAAGNTPVGGEATLRAGQARCLDAAAQIEEAKRKVAAASKPAEKAPAERVVDAAYAMLREAARELEQAHERLRDLPQQEPRARMLYEAAWAYRRAGEREAEVHRRKREQEGADKRETPPVPPSEGKAQDCYRKLIDTHADLPISNDARTELAEMLAGRGQNDAAVKLLQEAFDREPAADLNARVLLRLGDALMARGDYAGAAAKFQAAAPDLKHPLAGPVNYRLGECLLLANQPAKAVEKLSIFRDRGEFHNIPEVSDKALLRLGAAHAKAGQWEESRRSYEALIGRFGASNTLAADARYGTGWALQNLKRYDEAVAQYAEVTKSTLNELGAKALLQTGLCRLEQKRYPEAISALLLVPDTYDFPELSAAARCEAGRAYAESGQPDMARRLFERVARDNPPGDWAKVARERLEKLPKGN